MITQVSDPNKFLKYSSELIHPQDINGGVPMTKADFEKVTHSEKRLYGPRKLVLAGFTAETQSKFKTLLGMLQLENIPLVWASSDQQEQILKDIIELPDDSGKGISSELPRAIIVSGITEAELQNLMAGCRQAGMKKALWAVATPTSTTWPLKQLLAELEAERKALSKNNNGA